MPAINNRIVIEKTILGIFSGSSDLYDVGKRKDNTPHTNVRHRLTPQKLFGGTAFEKNERTPASKKMRINRIIC